jgi:hypothetical protein
MKSLLYAIFTGTLVCAVALAQDTTPPPNASPQQSPTTQAPSEEQAAKPSLSDSQQPAQPPSDTAQPQNPTRQAPSEEQSGQSNASGQRTNSGPTTNAPEAAGIKRLAPGSVFPVQLTKSIDAKKLKAGDEVVTKVTQDLKNNSGEVIIPKDTKVVGRVTEAQPRSKEQKESQVGIAFDRAVMTNGGEMQMPMSIQAIIGPQNNGPQNNNPSAGAGQPPEEAPAGRTAGSSSGQAPGTRGSTQQQIPSPSAGDTSGDSQTAANPRPPITAQTQGVIGVKDLKLENPAEGSTKGSVVTSEKNNVKLDSGTMLLLRVNQ